MSNNPQSNNPHFDDVCGQAALYALGKLTAEERRVFEQRLASGCPLCCAQVQDFQEVSESLTSLVAVTPPPALEARLMASIAGPKPSTDTPGRDIRMAKDAKWVDAPQPGVQFRFLHGRKTLLIKMEPGASYPSHPHAFDEHCLVLEGTIGDHSGLKLGSGDFLFMPAGSTHDPIFTDTGCTFLIAYS